ncbi:transposase [Nocardiopsis sp. EMB25]|uniref:transposase n=1 Tax=Nocardiopsis sp. EMB25 TaxID=2835867 RepID=UPI003FA384D8
MRYSCRGVRSLWCVPRFSESDSWTLGPRDLKEASWDVVDGPPSSAARCWTWSRPGAASPTLSRDLGISTETVYAWRRQDRIDRGLAPGLTSAEKTALAAANKRIAQLEAELAIHRRASALLGKVGRKKTVRGDRGGGHRGTSGPGRRLGAGSVGIGVLCLA